MGVPVVTNPNTVAVKAPPIVQENPLEAANPANPQHVQPVEHPSTKPETNSRVADSHKPAPAPAPVTVLRDGAYAVVASNGAMS